MRKFDVEKHNKINHTSSNIIYLNQYVEPPTFLVTASLKVRAYLGSMGLEKTNDGNNKEMAIYDIKSKLDLRYVHAYLEKPIFTLLNIEAIPEDLRKDWFELTRNIMEGIGRVEQVSSSVFAIIPDDVVFIDDSKKKVKRNGLK